MPLNKLIKNFLPLPAIVACSIAAAATGYSAASYLLTSKNVEAAVIQAELVNRQSIEKPISELQERVDDYDRKGIIYAAISGALTGSTLYLVLREAKKE